MEKAEALAKLNLASGVEYEEVLAARDQKIFELKNEILQKYMVPILLNKKIPLIQDLMLTEHVLLQNLEEAAGPDIPSWQEKPTNRFHFLESYEAHISQLKLLLMNCSTFDQLHKIVQALIIAQEYYMVLFRMLFNEFSEALPEEVNTRELIDTGKLLLSLKKGELDNKQIWEIELELARIDKIQALKQA